MKFSSSLRKGFISLTGYWIYKKKDLPVGVDLRSDLENRFNIHPLTIFDIGANYGQTAKHYSEEFPNANIYSFEPVLASYQKLAENSKTMQNVRCFHLALGKEKQELEISLFDENNSQLNSLKQTNSNIGGKKEKIKVESIDGFTAENKITQIDLLKIDTEGFEVEVLSGAIKMLGAKKIRSIICEVALSQKNTRNTQLAALIDLLDQQNYFFVGLYETNVNYYKEGLAYSNALFILK